MTSSRRQPVPPDLLALFQQLRQAADFYYPDNLGCDWQIHLPGGRTAILPAPACRNVTVVDDQSPNLSGDVRFGPGCRSVKWGDETYSFTEPQSRVIATLRESWEAGTPDVPDDDLLRAAATSSVRLVDVFRNSPGWGEFVIEGSTRGTHRIAAETPS